jgi:hypothetical protein
MNVLQEKIPMLITRAASFEADRASGLVSLITAEKEIQALGVPRDRDRWMRNHRVLDAGVRLWRCGGWVDCRSGGDVRALF